MNPFRENPHALEASEKFYRKFYNDNKLRRIILGINPGRFGAGVTGVPFTDTKRMEQICGIKIKDLTSHEPSSVFIYKMIDAYGGAKKFYSRFYINSICPLGFVSKNKKDKEVNYNYYDSKDLFSDVKPFIIRTLKKQIKLGIDTSVCFCLGTGKNFGALTLLNDEHKFFGKIIPLEHPRYIMQYKMKSIELYVRKFIELLDS